MHSPRVPCLSRVLLARLGAAVLVVTSGGAAILFASADAARPWWPEAAFILGLGVLALLGAGLVAREALPGRAALVGWTSKRPPDRQLASQLLCPPGVSGDLVEAVRRLDDALEQWLAQHRTARRKAEQIERYESEFLTTLSHELRTPLNSILGFSQVLLDDIDGPLTAEQREDVETIRAAGHHLRELVDDVIDLAHIESVLFTLERQEVEVAPLIRESARLLEAQRRGRPVSIEVRIAEGVSTVDADPKRLRQIVMNLATNALKFTERGSVVLEAVGVDGGVRISVHDTGPGIPRTELASIFDEFTHARSTRRMGQGTGLGLAICKRLVDLHGGEIHVDSTIGEGSAFHVLLGQPAGERG